MAKKTSIPKGTRDFSPAEIAKRNYIFDTVRKHFKRFGYQPIETPSFENSDTLMGKYGEEGDRLIFKILNSGDYLSKNYPTLYVSLRKLENQIAQWFQKIKEGTNFLFEFEPGILDISLLEDKLNNLANEGQSSEYSNTALQLIIKEYQSLFLRKKLGSFTSQVSEKALRYDLTVPFARYVVMHQNELTFPFKRYQIQPVWRADRPQKGRFREFYQCDADVVGNDSLLQEVELVQLYDAVFTDLGLEGATIKLNNRKILSGIAELIGAKDQLIQFTVALDKLDKIGEEGVIKEMLGHGISEAAIEKLKPLFALDGDSMAQLETLATMLQNSEEGTKGVEELRFILEHSQALGLQNSALALDVTLARGLNYYTGAIFEVSAPEGVKMGSIGGGGRYDDLTGIFGLKNVSGVGISFGLDRIYLVLEELGLFPESVSESLQVLCINFGDAEALASMQLIKQLREAGVACELYPSNAKMNKQMKYANARQVPFVVMIGDQELEAQNFVVKEMGTGTQSTYDLNDINPFLEAIR